MSSSCEFVSSSPMLSSKTKIMALESTLQQSISYCQDFMKQFEQLCIESENYKTQFNTLKEKCDRKRCNSSEELKKDIESKNNIIQSVASTLTKLHETKNFNILTDVFKILCGDKTVNIPNLDLEQIKHSNSNIKKEVLTPKKQFLTPIKEPFTPKNEILNVKTDVAIKDESLSEIEGTPTGRTSPIITTRKFRSSSSASITELRDKKKCPDNWPTPDRKAVKLTYPSPTATRGKGRLKQSRLNLVPLRQMNVVDLTSSPELMTVTRCSQSEGFVQPLVKKESTDNDDTILPSPTSGPNNFMYKSTSVHSPIKFKKPPVCLKSKPEVQAPIICDRENNTPENVVNNIINQAEDSINLLKPGRFIGILDEHSPIKVEPIEDETLCELPASLSLLQHVDRIEQEEKPIICSPKKEPLAENINITNVPEDNDSSMSLLRHIKVSPKEDKVKRQLSCNKKQQPVEPIYKEQVPRTKAEKRKLRGWNCDECKNFYDELYQDDPDMLAKKMEECSKHRGKNNPARPKTPEGFWNPRWSVPSDTEEFNRRNNAD